MGVLRIVMRLVRSLIKEMKNRFRLKPKKLHVYQDEFDPSHLTEEYINAMKEAFSEAK